MAFSLDDAGIQASAELVTLAQQFGDTSSSMDPLTAIGTSPQSSALCMRTPHFVMFEMRQCPLKSPKAETKRARIRLIRALLRSRRPRSKVNQSRVNGFSTPLPRRFPRERGCAD